MGKKSFFVVFFIYILILSLLGFFFSRSNKYEPPQKDVSLLKIIDGNVFDKNNQKVNFRGISLPNGVYNIKYPYELFNSEYELKEADYQRIASLNMNSVRFYLQYHWLKDQYDLFNYLDNQIALAKKYGIYIILNLHYFGETNQIQKGTEDGFYKGSSKYDLLDFWKKISDRYKDEDTIAAYDLLNEPNTSSFFSEQKLYEKYKEIIKLIRENNDNHILIISDPVNKFSEALNRDIHLQVPFIKLDDNNLMYQFHWYEPIEFTHQGFFETDYFELGADYPMEKKMDNYKGGFYQTPYISETNGQWIEYKTQWIDMNLANCDFDPVEDRFNLSLSFSGLKGKVWFDDISLYRKDIHGNITRLPVPNHDISNSKSFIGWVKAPKSSSSPARWNNMNDPETKGIECHIDWDSDHTGNGSGSLYADCTNALWGAHDSWATWGQSGSAVSTYYPIDKESTYQVKFWVKTENNPAYTVAVGLGIYNVKEILFNKFTMKNLIHEYYSKWSKKHNVPLYCGEFGTTNPGLLDSSFLSNQQGLWVKDMIEILDSEIGHWSYHSYKSYSPRSDLFGLYNDKVDREIVKVLRNK